MIMDGAEGLIFKLSALGLYITVHALACQEQANKSARFFLCMSVVIQVIVLRT